MSRIVDPEELLPDYTELLSFVIPGRPSTKKTHQNVVYVKGKVRILPSKQYAQFENTAKKPCEQAWKNKGKSPIDYGIGILMRVYLNNWIVGDHNGYMQAIGDILQKWGIIEDDSWIMWISDDQHWLGNIDKENPRVEIKIVRLRHPKENFREEKEIKEAKRQSNKNNEKPTSKKT